MFHFCASSRVKNANVLVYSQQMYVQYGRHYAADTQPCRCLTSDTLGETCGSMWNIHFYFPMKR
jgi:hypothetical protein